MTISDSNSQNELENLVNLSKFIIDRVQAQREEQNKPPAVLEDIFPALCSTAQEMEVMTYSPFDFDEPEAKAEVEKYRLEQVISKVYSRYGDATKSLLRSSMTNAGDQLLPMPSSLPAQPVVDNLSFVPVKREPAAQEKPAPTTKRDQAYAVTQTLLNNCSIKILGEAIYCYNGTHYAHTTDENLRRIIMGLCRQKIEQEGNARLVDEVFRLLLCEPAICDHPENIASNLVSFQNGVYDLKIHRLFVHNPIYNTYYVLRANWTESSFHPIFSQFLNDITGGDVTLQLRIMEIIGYCLVPDTAAKAFFVFQGVPDSGKSVLAAFIRGCLDPEAIVAADILSLGERFAASNLIGRQLCTSMDLPSTPLNARTVSTFKMMTGGDPITADVKYRPHVTFFNRARFILGTNHPLLTQNEDPAFFRRAVAVPFFYTVPPAQQDRNLLTKLESERDAVICSAFRAYEELKARNYQFSGKYPLNGIFQYYSGVTPQMSEETVLQDFVKKYFTPDLCGEVFIQDALQLLRSKTSLSIPEQVFSTKFLNACQAVGFSNVKRAGKKRREKGGNPQAWLSGLRLMGM